MGSCENGHELMGYIKYGEFLDQPRNYQLLKKDCTAWSLTVSY
jgi:hypothetical protein